MSIVLSGRRRVGVAIAALAFAVMVIVAVSIQAKQPAKPPKKARKIQSMAKHKKFRDKLRAESMESLEEKGKKGKKRISLDQQFSQLLRSAPRLDVPANRQALVNKLRTIEKKQQKAWHRRARKDRIPLVIDGQDSYVQFVRYFGDRPLYYTTTNVQAATSTAADLIRNTSPYNVNGNGVTVGVWDGGSVLSTHQEFNGRINVMDGASSHWHATHVGGTIAAAGLYAPSLGMAPSAEIDSYDWNSDTSEMTNRAMATPGEAGKLTLSNHSYGFVAGWSWDGSSWEWTGNGTDQNGSEPLFGLYYLDTADWDSLVYAAPYFLPFKSAGNDRSNNPSNGDTVYINNQPVTYDSSIHPPGDGFHRPDLGPGYDTVGAQGCAKNIITIGAVHETTRDSSGIRTGGSSMSSFSGWGPTDDGRIKPDVVANGTDLTSAHDNTNASYATASGTSMSSPNACGSAALLVDYYFQRTAGYMRASTLKGLLIHTADDIGNAGPDYSNGWGQVNVKAAADVIASTVDGGVHSITEAKLTSSDTSHTYNIKWDGTSPLRVTICWTDPAASWTSTENDPTSRLVNDLDLRLRDPSDTTTHWPYSLDPSNPSLAATATTENNLDNVEQVYIASPSPGTYTITVDFDGVLTNGEQWYSLIVSGADYGRKVLFVNQNVVGGANDGSNWPNAFTHLQDALDVVEAGYEIWVARGTYRPDAESVDDEHEDGDQNETFTLLNDVAIYGGFAGNEALRTQRNPALNKTILSGDLADNDVAGFGNRTDNAYHVVTASGAGVTDKAILDGFTIEGGNANGGGIASSAFGGGIFIGASAAPTIVDCTITGNAAATSGGGIRVIGAAPTISRCLILANRTDGTIGDRHGGGLSIVNVPGTITIENCVIAGNEAVNDGGGVAVLNCSGTVVLRNCSFAGNRAVRGGALVSVDCTTTVTNCILWHDLATSGDKEIALIGTGAVTVTYSCVDQAAYDVGTNFRDDPLYVDSRYDWSLKPGSPCLNAANAAVAPTIDITGADRDSAPDVGAYESSDSAGIIYVDIDATGAENGTSWDDAFTVLQDALDAWQAGYEIWVAAGTYEPTERWTGNNSRGNGFVLVDGMRLYGGFAGTETSRDQRNWTANVTRLSGDLQGDDDGEMPDSDNVYNVVLVFNATDQTELDGFVVSGGSTINQGPRREGAGLLCDSSSIRVRNCTFELNEAMYGAGVSNVYGSSPLYENCTFRSNATTVVGGGASDWDSSTTTYLRCTFIQNQSTDQGGGGLYTSTSSSVTVTNCVFDRNQADDGGAVRNDGAISFESCTFSGNGSSTLLLVGASESTSITNSILWGNTGSLFTLSSGAAAATVTHSDVQGGFTGTGNINQNPLFTGVGDYGLQNSSPCIGQADTSTSPAMDIRGYPRDGDPDMGAYEYLVLPSGIVYVDADATGLNDGTSWANAYKHLQDGLTHGGAEIWVAEGTYRPDEKSPGDRSKYFGINQASRIYGGFKGTEVLRGQRDWFANPTVLDGDLSANDGPSRSNNDENAFQVVVMLGLTSSTTLDGFVITGGNANGGGILDNGGGIYVSGGAPGIFNCTVRDNASVMFGGGLYVLSGAPRVTDCTFKDNIAWTIGGGVCNVGNGFKRYNRCTFEDGNAILGGGAADWQSTSTDYTNCVFKDNRTAYAGGAGYFSYSSTVRMMNCTLVDNIADSAGGGMGAVASGVTVTNTISWGNRAKLETTSNEYQTGTGAAFTITYSCIAGIATGDGNNNLDTDPQLDANLVPQAAAVIDAGTPTGAPTVDRRGYTRVGNPDIGAFENGGVPPAPAPPAPAPAPIINIDSCVE